jgi:membrane protein implicated in regulation of membrane protease activity
VGHARDYSTCPACGGSVERLAWSPSRKLIKAGAIDLAVGAAVFGFAVLERTELSKREWMIFFFGGAAAIVFALVTLGRGLAAAGGKGATGRTNVAMSEREAQRVEEALARRKGYTARGLAVLDLLSRHLGPSIRLLPCLAVPVVPFPSSAVYSGIAVLAITCALPVCGLVFSWGEPAFWEQYRWLLAVLGLILLITATAVGWQVWRWRRRKRRVEESLARAEAELEKSAKLPETERKEAAGNVARSLLAEFGGKSGPT